MSDSKMIWSYFLQLSVHMWDDENSPPRGWYLPVRYDETHLTPAFAERLAPILRQELQTRGLY